jgi:hypothetical protein
MVGWIEIDDIASDFDVALGTATTRFGFPTRNGDIRMTINPEDSTEFISVDSRQLDADLEAEFARLLQRTRAK